MNAASALLQDVVCVQCNLCGADEAEPLYHNDSFGMGLTTVICRRCGLIYTNPRPTRQAYERFYASEFRQFYDGVSEPDEWFLTYHDSVSVAMKRIALYSDVLATARSLLEIGCETGAFLGRLKLEHPHLRLLGIEPASSFAKFAEARFGIPVMNAFLENSHLESSQFDVAAMFHVLEHSLDPSAALSEVHRLLDRNGWLCLEVPNVRANWRGLGMLHIAHTYLFSPATITSLLRKCGFTVERLDDSESQPVEVSMSVLARRANPSPQVRSPRALDDVSEIQALFQKRLGSPLMFFWRRRLRNALATLVGTRRARIAAKWLRTHMRFRRRSHCGF